MPDKYLSLWAALWDALPDPIRAAIVGAAVALIRVMYDGREPSIVRRLLECTLCGAIALSIASLAEALGIQGDYSTFAGGAIGLLGADTVRAWATRIGEQRIKDLET
ncbi:phage holin, lambda family [Azoarcus sp. PA01]|nr:phage holin, lambda family [Azoarcus sp. PA01]